MRAIGDNLQAVLQRIAHAARDAGRDPAEVTLLAVSKTHPAALVEQAMAAGQRAFGENYEQEAVEKMDAVKGSPHLPEWHLIGPLQSNKTRVVAERFQWVHTLDREKTARRLSAQRPASAPPLNVLVQVNVSREASKSGISMEETPSLVRQISSLPKLRLRGLMAMPEPGAERARFHEVKDLFERLKSKFGFDTLSMGMSDDMETAIAEGATMVRIGTAIFGQRGVGSRRQERNAA